MEVKVVDFVQMKAMKRPNSLGTQNTEVNCTNVQ